MKTGKEMAEVLENFVNSANREDVAEFTKGVMCMHRTLQQSMMKLMLATIQKWAECGKNNNFDLRNEATCKLSEKICTKFDKYDMALPLI